MTKAETFTGDHAVLEDEANRYAALYEKRALLLTQVRELNRQLEAETLEMDDEQFAPEIRRTIQDILVQDEAHTKAAQGLMSHIKSGMKDLRMGKEASTRYQTEYTVDSGLHFDSRN